MLTATPPSTMQSLVAIKEHELAGDIFENCYCYDEPSINVFGEPLVPVTTAAIDMAIEDAGLDVSNAIKLVFSEDKADLNLGSQYPIIQLVIKEIDPCGHTYITDIRGNEEVWLCKHLLDYFDRPPVVFYTQVQPLYD